MASQSKTKTVKFEVGQFVMFNNRVGQVSRIAKNGAIYVIVLGETTVADQTREELRVKKADLQLVNDILERTGDAVSVENYARHVIRNNISCAVSSNAKLVDDGAYELAPDYIPSPGCLAYCEWEGSADEARVLELVGLDLVKLANLYTGKSKVEVVEAAKPLEEIEDTIQSIEEAAQEIEVVEAAPVPQGWDKIEAGLEVEAATQESEAWMETDESIEKPPVAAPTMPGPIELAEATYALRELTFSVTRHSILTAFIDMALNKDILGYNYQVASNIKNLMAAAFDPVHDSGGYARINTWMMAALGLLVKNKDRVAKMLRQPIEAAPIKIDRVTKLGMWLDRMMHREGAQVNDMTAAYDSCYVYDALGKQLKAYAFVVVEVAAPPAGGRAKVKALKDPMGYYTKHLTAQSAISARQQHGKRVHRKSPDWHLYCGIVPVLKTGLSTQAAIDDVMASVIGSGKLE